MLVRYGEMLERPGAVAFLSRMVPTQQMKAVMSALYCRPLSPSPSYPRRSLTAAATPSSHRLPRPSTAGARTLRPTLPFLLFPPQRFSSRPLVIFSASSSFATSKPVLFWTIRGIFRHTGVRPNAVIHHPRCNTPYNVVLCRMAGPSLALMLLPNQPPPPSFSSRRAALCRGAPLLSRYARAFLARSGFLP